MINILTFEELADLCRRMLEKLVYTIASLLPRHIRSVKSGVVSYGCTTQMENLHLCGAAGKVMDSTHPLIRMASNPFLKE